MATLSLEPEVCFTIDGFGVREKCISMIITFHSYATQFKNNPAISMFLVLLVYTQAVYLKHLCVCIYKQRGIIAIVVFPKHFSF